MSAILKPMRLHSRDLAVLSDFLEVGFLDMPTIHARHFPKDKTRKACLRRLRLLCGHELATIVPVTVAYATVDGGRPHRIFRITQRGADVYSELTGTSPVTLHRRDPQPETVLHRLGVARLRLAVNDACADEKLPRPIWIGEYDTVPGVGLNAKNHERFVLCEKFTIEDGSKASCWADASCRLQIPVPNAGAEPSWHPLIIYWEYDRSTELLKQVARKIPGYAALLASGSYQKHWRDVPIPTVRVFFVVQSEKRLRNIAATIKGMPGSEFVRLTVESHLTAERILADPIWKTVSGDTRAILRSPSYSS